MTDQRTKPHVVLTGGRKPSFPIKAVWHREGFRYEYPGDGEEYWWWDHRSSPNDIIAVERADKEQQQ